MFAIEKLSDVGTLLSTVYRERLQSGKLPDAATVRGPVGLFVVRANNGAASTLAEEVVDSFAYWSPRSAHYFDGLFLGWGYDGAGTARFMDEQFTRCLDDLEGLLEWKHSERFDLLVTDFVYHSATGTGELDFAQCVPLNLSQLVDEKKLGQVSSLLGELIAPSRASRERAAEISVADLSDYVAVLRTRRFLWQQLIKKLGAVVGWADEVAPYAVRDLRRKRPVEREME